MEVMSQNISWCIARNTKSVFSQLLPHSTHLF
jgi:hypothetical protein